MKVMQKRGRGHRDELVEWHSRLWAVGSDRSFLKTLFDAARRHATSEAVRANSDGRYLSAGNADRLSMLGGSALIRIRAHN
jgi:hypothetical protein